MTAAALADSKQDRVAEARRELDMAQERLRVAERRADRTRDGRDDAIRDRERFAQQLSDANQTEGELTRSLATAETEALAAKTQRDVVQRSVAVNETRFKAAKRAVVEANEELTVAKKEAEAAFLRTDESRSRLAAITDSTTALETERQRVIGALADDSTYKSLKAAAAAAEASVQVARDATPLDQRTLTVASQAWIDAKTALQGFEKQACERDAAYVATAATLETAKEAHETALAAFRASIEQTPAIAAQVERRAAVQVEQESAQREAATAAADLKQAEAELRRLSGNYNRVELRLRDVRITRDKLATQVVALERMVRAAEADLVKAEREILRAQREVADARRKLAQAERS